MTLEQHKQQEKGLQDKIEETLIDIRSHNKITLTEIASRLGVANAHFNKVANGKKKGSRQLLKGLELLKHSLEFPPIIWPNEESAKEAISRAAAVDLSLEDFLAQCAIRYGAQVADELITNPIRQVIIHDPRPKLIKKISSGAPSGISKRAEATHASDKKKA